MAESERAESLEINYQSNGGKNGIDLPSILGGKVDGNVREAFFKLYDFFKDRLREKEDEHREHVRLLERQVEQERQKRKDFQRDEEARIKSDNQTRILLRRRVDEMDKSLRSGRRWLVGTAGLACGSLMLAGGLSLDRVIRDPQVSPGEVAQLKARIDSYEEQIQAQNAQMKSFMVAQNDKSGAILKAIDVIKHNQSLVEFYTSEDTRTVFKELHDWVKTQKGKASESSEGN